MTPYREWFNNYKLVTSSIVYIGIDQSYVVIDMGDVVIKLGDGTERVFKWDKHVPDLTQSLISLGELVKECYAFRGCGSDLKITKGSMVYFREVKNDIYLLKDDFKMPTIVVDYAPNFSSVQLWHKKLTHIIEVGLMELNK